MYTESTLTIGDDANIGVHNLEAGTELYHKDTSALDRPFAQAKAKPFYILGEWKDHGYDFASEIVGTPNNIEFSCIYGRDGAEDSDWSLLSDTKPLTSNADCQRPAGIRAVPVRSVDSQGSPVLWKHSCLLLIIMAVIAMVLCVRSHFLHRKELNGSTESLPLLAND